LFVLINENTYSNSLPSALQKLQKLIMDNKSLMQKAIKLSVENVKNGGGPFGAVIAKEGKVIATGVNRVTGKNDPTAHAEITAIRKAARKLGTFDLSGCEIFTSCEPCPMCLSAIYWAHLDRIYYGNTKIHAQAIGFDDSFIYDELNLHPENRKIGMKQLLPEEALHAFDDWAKKGDKVRY
jgi:tRNA(Arg) A34 adenosine deaminase TadA